MATALTELVALIGLVLLGLLVVWAGATLGMVRDWAEIRRRLSLAVIRKHFFCPGKGKEVEADFLVRRGEPWNLLDVEACSAFKGEKVRCPKSCIYLPEAQMAPPLSEHAPCPACGEIPQSSRTKPV